MRAGRSDFCDVHSTRITFVAAVREKETRTLERKPLLDTFQSEGTPADPVLFIPRITFVAGDSGKREQLLTPHKIYTEPINTTI